MDPAQAVEAEDADTQRIDPGIGESIVDIKTETLTNYINTQGFPQPEV